MYRQSLATFSAVFGAILLLPSLGMAAFIHTKTLENAFQNQDEMASRIAPSNIQILPANTAAFVHINLSGYRGNETAASLMGMILGKAFPKKFGSKRPFNSLLGLGLKLIGVKDAQKIADGADGDAFMVLTGNPGSKLSEEAKVPLGILIRDPQAILLPAQLRDRIAGALNGNIPYYKLPMATAYLFAYQNYIGVAAEPQELYELALGLTSEKGEYAKSKSWSQAARLYNPDSLISLVVSGADKVPELHTNPKLKALENMTFALNFNASPNGLDLDASLVDPRPGHYLYFHPFSGVFDLKSLLPMSAGFEPYVHFLTQPFSSLDPKRKDSKYGIEQLLTHSAFGLGIYPQRIVNGTAQGLDLLIGLESSNAPHEFRALLQSGLKEKDGSRAIPLQKVNLKGASSAFELAPKIAHQIRLSILKSLGTSDARLRPLIEDKTLIAATTVDRVYLSTSKSLLVKALINSRLQRKVASEANAQNMYLEIDANPLGILNGMLPIFMGKASAEDRKFLSFAQLFFAGKAGDFKLNVFQAPSGLTLNVHIPGNLGLLNMFLNLTQNQ